MRARVFYWEQMTFDVRSFVDSQCPSRVVVEGFDFQDGTLGIFEAKSATFSVGDRGYYQHTIHRDRCIWWHKPYNHWWIGDCSGRGQNQGHAWLEPTEALCPTDSKAGDWRRGGSDEQILTGLVRVASDSEIQIRPDSGGLDL